MSQYLNDNFTNDIKKWIEIDNEIQTLNNNLKELRQSRNSKAEIITKYIEQHNLTKHTKAVHDKQKDHQCEICQKSFFAQSDPDLIGDHIFPSDR